MRQTALEVHQHIESMRPVTRPDHIGFPMSTFLSCGGRRRAHLDAGSVLDSLGGIPIRPLRFPLGMMARQQTTSFRYGTIHVLVNDSVTHGGQLVLLLKQPCDQFRGSSNR